MGDEEVEKTDAELAQEEAVAEQQEELAEGDDALAESFQMEAVNLGLQLKQVRDKEDALIRLAEEWLAEQETDPEPPPVEEIPPPEANEEDDLLS
jgi:hypothetical protein